MFMREDSRIDTRALAVLRIGLGVLLIVDILFRARNFSLFYTDNGIVPYDLVATDIYSYPTAAFPIWELSTHPAVTAVLFTASIVVGVLLITGYNTRLATVLAFLLVSAVDARNPYVLSYADLLFHLLLLWAMFLPLGEKWSIDALQRTRSPRESIASLWSALILFQMINMYLANAYHKLQPDWSWSGDVLPILLSLDHITFTHVQYVNGFTPLLEVLSYTWLVLMVVSPALFLLRGHPRALLAAAIFGAHLSMAVTLRIGAFPYASMLGVLLFVQSDTWNLTARYVNRLPSVTSVGYRIRCAGRRVARGLETVEPAPAAQHRAGKAAVRVLIAVFLVASVALAGVTVADHAGVVETDRDAVETIDATMHVFGLHQPPWSFYAADPPYTDKYYVFPAVTSDGTVVDAFNDRALSYDRPYAGSSLHKQYDHTYRERFFMNHMSNDDRAVSDELREEYAAYLCDTWEGDDGESLETITMYQVEEEVTGETRLDRDDRTVEYHHLGDFSCDGSPAVTVDTPNSE